MLMDIIRIAIIFIIIFAILKNLKTLFKAAVVILIILLLLRIAGF